MPVGGVALALQIKKPAAPYSRAGGSRTTLGEEALDFRVRDGNGYGRLSVATGGKPEIGSEENRNAERQEPHTLVKFASFRSRRTLPVSKLQALGSKLQASGRNKPSLTTD